MSMETIENMAKAYAGARTELAAEVQALQDEIEAVKRRRLPAIKHALAEARDCQDQLRAEVELSPELFKRPKSRIFHGVKVGFMKGKGKLVWADEEAVVRRIHERLPSKYDQLVKIVEKPVRKALEQLSIEELKAIGVTVEQIGDQVIVKPVDSDIDKLISALLTDSELERMQQEAA